MQHRKSVALLSTIVNPSEIIYAVTMRDILDAIAMRMGEDALALPVGDLELARDEVRDVLEHHQDIREYIDMGLDAWEIVRTL